ncbi:MULTISPECIES: autorepressor SdpR family transcription factor [unclassified Candidatus Frackibacter]|uniref:autorepressor SdpR family transcription factor n=1 Tax=unclassified Candidatus Frackibacter TaxID=2648818 RepID=UPI000880D492|nr:MULTISPECIES: autorepressor SdpR family transcription factor [unclassified Candidatus Frackibacter]SDC62446.1 DNA-binding transcriptional regulator, ArsR family [Candidatus Frackibacter sp. WG11]SEM76211.1 DNA-binding transcriptional regulator, ArsR family [Candidatus Frackibacter sp. WG12]SFL86282.1 DNA-binding transcriptional regulator, ArsR family [Candidatus Frackibacter sp. WG13]
MTLNFDQTFKALADNNRRKILILLKEKDLTAGEIAEEFNISKPSISHHLKILKNADLVDARREGQNIYYSLKMTVFQEILNGFMGLFKEEDDDNEDV